MVKPCLVPTLKGLNVNVPVFIFDPFRIDIPILFFHGFYPRLLILHPLGMRLRGDRITGNRDMHATCSEGQAARD